MRKTHALVQVAMVLLAEPHEKHWGYDVGKKAGIRSGVLYPMFTRMLTEGWLTDGWEELDLNVDKRPPRRYYELTEKGKQQLGALLAEARSDTRFTHLGWVQ